MIESHDRDLAVVLHILGIFFPLFGPLILWLIYKEQSDFINQHGKEALNFHLSMYIYSAIVGMLCFLLIGFIILPVLFILMIVFPILAAVKASKGELYQYPLSFRFFK